MTALAEHHSLNGVIDLSTISTNLWLVYWEWGYWHPWQLRILDPYLQTAEICEVAGNDLIAAGSFFIQKLEFKNRSGYVSEHRNLVVL